jgi:hypothetical protein
MVVKMMVIDSESTTKIEQNQEPIIGAAVKAQLEQTKAQLEQTTTTKTWHCHSWLALFLYKYREPL